MAELRDRLQDALGDAYRIERELGGGGMSRLFIAEESSLHRRVVVKVLPPEFASEVSAERFRREIEVAANLQHPNILPVLAAGTRDDLLYYVIPYVPGESLRHRLTQQGQLPVAEALQILREIADALAHAHAEGIIHRDIKPENILLLGGHAVLTDFGVARALVEARSGERLTETGLAVGTPGYMSPEQVAGDRHVDARADVYALAVVGYEMLTGKAPFEGPTAQAVLAAHLTATPKALTAVRPEVPASASEAIAKALAKNPAERLQTAAALRDALRIESTRQPIARRTWLLWGGVAALLLLGAGLVFNRQNRVGALDADLIAVAPFDVLAPHLELWREGLVDIVSRNLDGAGRLRSISPTVVIRRWSGRADPSAATALGTSTGAGLVVFRRVVGAGTDSIRLTATLLDVARGSVLAELDVRDHAERLDRVADSLSVGILRELGRTRPVGAVRLASLGSTSLPAIKLFLSAEQFYRRGQWDSTLSYARRAVAIDSTFTLALRRISNSLWWSNTNVTPDLLRAGAHNHGLAPRESLLVQVDSVWGALNEGKALAWPMLRRLETTLTEVTRRYPEDAEAWYMTGEMNFHWGSQVSLRRTRRQAFDAFARAIALDSAFGPAYGHIVGLALGLEEPELARKYAEAYLRVGADREGSASLRAALDLLEHPGAPGPATRALFDTATARRALEAWRYLRSGTDSGEAAVAAARAFTVSRHPKDAVDSVQQKWVLPTALAHRGHLREAVKTMWVAGVDSGSGNELNFLTLLRLGAIPPDSAERWLATRLAQKDGWAWAGASWWARRADTAGLQRIAALARAKSGRGASTTNNETFWRYVADAAVPYLALARHDTATALRLFAQVPDSLCRFCIMERLTFAQLLSAKGRDREAAALLEDPLHDADTSTPTEVLWALERGRVNERLGKKDTAVEAYSFVAAVWRNADPELQPLVQEAKSGLARLSAEPKR